MNRNHKIEQQINETLSCLDDSVEVTVSPLFADKLTARIADIHMARRSPYRSGAFYYGVILLMAGLNVAALTISFRGQTQQTTGSDGSISILASEYGIGQSVEMTL